MDAGIIKSESFISPVLCPENFLICSQIHSSHVLCNLNFPKSFANWLPSGFGQWETLMKDWQLGRREKQGYYFPFLSTSGGDSSVGCIFPVIPVHRKDSPSLVPASKHEYPSSNKLLLSWSGSWALIITTILLFLKS